MLAFLWSNARVNTRQQQVTLVTATKIPKSLDPCSFFLRLIGKCLIFEYLIGCKKELNGSLHIFSLDMHWPLSWGLGHYDCDGVRLGVGWFWGFSVTRCFGREKYFCIFILPYQKFPLVTNLVLVKQQKGSTNKDFKKKVCVYCPIIQISFYIT